MSESSGAVVGALLVAIVVSICFALTFRSFWRAQPRPIPDLAAWTYAAFSAVALVVGVAVRAAVEDWYAGYLAAIFIVLLGFVTAHNWPRTRRSRFSKAFANTTLVFVAIILLAAIAIAESGIEEIRTAEARIGRLKRFTEADIRQFAARRVPGKTDVSNGDDLAPYRISNLEMLLADPEFQDVATIVENARPGRELKSYRSALADAQHRRISAQDRVRHSFWPITGILCGVTFVGVTLARTIEGRTSRASTSRKRDLRPALIVALVSLGAFLVTISLQAVLKNAVFAALGTGLLTMAGLVYRRLAHPREPEVNDGNEQDRRPTPPRAP